MSKIRVHVEPPFDVLYNLPEGTDKVICIGGRGGRKTYEVSKFSCFDAVIRNRRQAILRDEKETIRESILNEIYSRYDTANQHGHLNGKYDKTTSGLRNLNSGDMQIFTKGFRASSNDKKSNMKGISEVDTAIVEEMEDIRDPVKYNTFEDSVRTKDRLIIFILNTPDIQHWIVKQYFNLIVVTKADVLSTKATEDDKGNLIGPNGETATYYKLVPKKIPGFVCIQSSFRDNPHLPESVVRKYESYGDPDSPFYDWHYYMTSILGYASSGRQGQVYKKVKPITLSEYLAIDAREIYGQDFGTASPAGLVGVKNVGNRTYARELNYVGMDTLGIMKKYHELQINPTKDLIIADSAEPGSIGKLRNGFPRNELTEELISRYPNLLKGYNIYPAVKGPGSINTGVSLMNSMEMFAVDTSEHLWEEIYNHVYAKDKWENFTSDPEDNNNHLLDPWRYVNTARGRFY